jgi:hypothetical protein
MMKSGGVRKGLALALVLALTMSSAAAQANAGGVTKEDEAAARATAAAFAERLGATRDFAAVARELYAEDFMTRQLKGLTHRAAGPPPTDFMLQGIPSLTFGVSLASEAGVEDWKRVRFAADNLLHFVFLSMISSYSLEELGGPEGQDARNILGVFPPEAIKVLNANPAAANLLTRKGGEVVVRTPGELRALASALEEAVRLTRPRLAELLSKGKHLEANTRLFKEKLAPDEVKAYDDAEVFGFPKGTRLYTLFAPNGYMLVLVRQGGGMRVAWAGLPSN